MCLKLAKLTAENIATNSAAILASEANIQAVKLANSGLIQADGNLVLASADVVNNGGTIKARSGLSIIASNDIVNYSGKMRGNTVALNAGRDLVTDGVISSFFVRAKSHIL